MDSLVRIAFNDITVIINKHNFGAAGRARHRLGMEPSVGDIFVLASTFFTYRKNRHRRIRPVVGNGFYNRISRPAVGAVDKWIVIAKVFWIQQLAEAVATGGRIGRYM